MTTRVISSIYDIGSDDIWERAAHSVNNMFSVPCQEKIIENRVLKHLLVNSTVRFRMRQVGGIPQVPSTT